MNHGALPTQSKYGAVAHRTRQRTIKSCNQCVHFSQPFVEWKCTHHFESSPIAKKRKLILWRLILTNVP